MNNISREDGIITVMLLRLKQQRLPRIKALHEKVLHGDVLDNYDLDFLNAVCSETKNCHQYCLQHPEYDDLFCRLTHFFHKIATTALENEKHQRLH